MCPTDEYKAPTDWTLLFAVVGILVFVYTCLWWITLAAAKGSL